MEVFCYLLVTTLALCVEQGTAAIPPRFEGTSLPGSLSFTVQTVPGLTCRGGNTGLGSTALRLDYRGPETQFQWRQIRDNISLPSKPANILVPVNGSASEVEGCVQLRLVQEEHGGGDCNCWELTNPVLNNFTMIQ